MNFPFQYPIVELPRKAECDPPIDETHLLAPFSKMGATSPVCQSRGSTPCCRGVSTKISLQHSEPLGTQEKPLLPQGPGIQGIVYRPPVMGESSTHTSIASSTEGVSGVKEVVKVLLPSLDQLPPTG